MKYRWMTVMAVASVLLAACGGSGDALGGPATTAATQTTEGATQTTAALDGATAAAAQVAIDQMVAGGMAREDAECYVNGLLSEFGIEELAALNDGSEISPEVTARMMALFQECGMDLGGLGEGGLSEMPSDFRELAAPRDEVDGPYTYGDDPDLDALWDACEAGSGEACDELFFQSPFGSEYEAFGNTCGNRMELLYVCSSLDE